MASSKEYLNFILDQLANMQNISHRAMMGEYIIYYNNKVVGGIYDDRLLLKPTEGVGKLIKAPIYEVPYTGAKAMLLVEDVDNKKLLQKLIETTYSQLPEPKPKRMI